MLKAENPPLTRAMTDFVSNVIVIGEEVEQVVFDGRSILHLILMKIFLDKDSRHKFIFRHRFD